MTTAKKTRKVSSTAKKAIKKLVAKQNRQVAKVNKTFEALSPADKRVYIARDVLEQIRLKKLIPTTGTWLTGVGDEPLVSEKDIKKDPELQEILAKTKQCEGCALGGIFMCTINAADKLKVSDLNGVQEFQEERKKDEGLEACYRTPFNAFEHGQVFYKDAFKYLKRFFTTNQLAKIENAFERGNGACRNEGDYESRNFALDVDDPTDRMTLIMQNIVVNKGTFKPSQKPVQVWATSGFVG